MLVSDIYKVIDDDTAFVIMFDNGTIAGRVFGNDWSEIPENVLEWRVYRVYVGPSSGKLYVECK